MQTYTHTCEQCDHRERLLLPDDVDGGTVQSALNAERMAEVEERMRLHQIGEHGALV